MSASISLITIMGLIGDNCGPCQKAAEAEDEEMVDEETKEAGWEDVGARKTAGTTAKEKRRRTPLDTMKKALSVTSFDGLVVVD